MPTPTPNPFPFPSMSGGNPFGGADLPGVIGAGQKSNEDSEHPYPGPMVPPAPPSCWPPKSPQDMIDWSKFSLAHLMGDRYTRTMLRNFFHDTVDRRMLAATLAPWYYPPWSSLPLMTLATGTSGAPGGTFNTIGSVYVPMGMCGVIRKIGHDTNNDVAGTGVADWAAVTWSFMLSQGPLTAASRFRLYGGDYGGFIGQIGQVESPTDVFLLIPEDTTLSWRASSAVEVEDLKVVMHGWMWEVRQAGAQKTGADHIAGAQR